MLRQFLYYFAFLNRAAGPLRFSGFSMYSGQRFAGFSLPSGSSCGIIVIAPIGQRTQHFSQPMQHYEPLRYA